MISISNTASSILDCRHSGHLPGFLKLLNIEGVDLYGGTKHSTVTALGKVLTPEQIQRGVTGHVSDAFKRYMLPDVNEALEATKAVEKIRKVTDPPVIHISEALGSDK